MMRQCKVDRFIESYCAENSIKLVMDPEIGKDDGFCYPTLKEIHMSLKYSSKQIKLAIFLHEVSHIRVARFKAQPYNTFECEYYSWFEAMKLNKKLFGKSFTKKQAQTMLKCLKTYCRSHYEFRKTIKEEDVED